MNDLDRRKLTLPLLLLLPAISWFVVARLDTPLDGTRRQQIKTLYRLVISTPERPLLIAALVAGLVLALGCVWALSRVIKRDFEGAEFKKFIRGTRFVSEAALVKLTKEKAPQVTVASIPIPRAAETLHILIPGSTGAGKSMAIREIAYKALRRGDRIIVADPNGDMLSKFYKPGDVILNPYDVRSVGWSWFNELRSDFDYKRYALSVVPRGTTREAEQWASYGRVLLAECAHKLVLTGNPSIRELFRWTNIEPAENLRAFLAGTAAESLFVEDAGRALGSARFVLSDKLAPHLDMPAGDFSLRRWLEDDTAGNLYITWREDMAVSLRPLISCWIDALATSILSLPEDENQRVWMFLDELATLEKLPSLVDALTKGRKHGLRVVAGLQSTAQLDSIYGRDEAQTLRACFRSLFVLGGARTDPQTAEDLSRSLGEHEVTRDYPGTSAGSRGATRSSSTKNDRERVIMPAQITSLPPLTGYLALAGDLPIARVMQDVLTFKSRVPGFVES